VDATNDPQAGLPRIPDPRPAPDVLTEDVLADDRLIEAVRTGVRGTDDADPLVRLLAAWRAARRRPRRGVRHGGLRCRRAVSD
jgi:hypothetical protein